MADSQLTEEMKLGFLTVVTEGSPYVGAYLVTNPWSRPLEFRLSTPVQPNRMQQILYGGTLRSYLCADLIGKTLVEKTRTVAQCIFTDREAVLDLRLFVGMPVVWLAGPGDPLAEDLIEEGACARPESPGRGPALCHPRFPDDRGFVQQLLTKLENSIDLQEPFGRIRDALGEARKMGAGNRG